MPEQARKLTELLEEKQEWNREVGQVFLFARMHSAATSQTQFAEDLGISQGYLSQIENGVRTPSSGTLNKLQTFMEGELRGDQDEADEEKDEAEAS